MGVGMAKNLLYLCILQVARHGMFGIAVARLFRGPGKTSISLIISPGSVHWG